MYIDDDVKLILCLFGVIFAFMGGIMCLDYHFDKKTCYTKYAEFQPEYVGYATGCMIKVDDQTVPAQSLRVNQ